MALGHVLIGLYAPFFDMSLFLGVFQDIVINWNLTPYMDAPFCQALNRLWLEGLDCTRTFGLFT